MAMQDPLPVMNREGRHLLFVEDDDCFRMAMKKYLSNSGFRVAEAASVEDARVLLRERIFDAVLMDLHLQDGNSCDLFTLLPEEILGRTIILSGGAIPPELLPWMERIYLFLEKPIDPRNFLSNIESCIAGKESTRQTAQRTGPSSS